MNNNIGSTLQAWVRQDMHWFAGDTRPASAFALVEHVSAACEEFGYLRPDIAPALAYVAWARWHESDAPKLFRSIGHRIKREALIDRGILPQTVLTEEAWSDLTEEGRRVGAVSAYTWTVKRAAARWLEGYKQRNPRWHYAFRRSQEAAT